jgi:alkyl hydroperoxide reductase subunit F
MYDLIIVGGGPAGLAASAYALRKRLRVLLVAQNLGGKTAITVQFPQTESHRVIRADELVRSFRDNLEYLSHAYMLGKVTTVSPRGDSYDVAVRPREDQGEELLQSRAVLIATGMRHQPAGVPGETRFQGKALGYSSISYSHLLADRSVFLVGNSRRTVDAALELSTQARKVFLYLEHTGKYHDVYTERLADVANVELIDASALVEFRGNEFAKSVVLRRPDGETVSYEADAFFIQRQPTPNSEPVSGLVDADGDGRIIVDTRNRTSEPGIFAAGDVTTTGFEQILVALGEGAKAALTAYEHLTFPH